MKKWIFIAILTFSSPVLAQVVNSNGVALYPQTFTTANLTASATSCLVSNNTAVMRLHLPNNAASASFTTSGTYTATATFQASGDNQITWAVAEGSQTSPGTTAITVTGLTDLCVVVTAYTSGTVVATINVLLNTGPAGPAGPAGAAGASGGGIGVTSFNVKNFGAFGDSAASDNCTASSFNLSCTDAAFTAADVGKRVSCASAFSTIVPATVTFTAFVNATNMTMSASNSGPGTCVWGHPDDVGVTAAVTAALAAAQTVSGTTGNPKPITADPCVYFPAGAYNLFNTAINLSPSSAKSGLCLLGDILDESRVYWLTGSTNAQNAGITESNLNNLRIENITFDGANQNSTFVNGALFLNGNNTVLNNVNTQRFQNGGITMNGGSILGYNVQATSNGGVGFSCSGCNGEVRNWLFSNNSQGNVVVNNARGLPQGNGMRFWGGLDDECGASVACFQITNSSDVWIIGSAGYGSTHGAFTVDGTSHVHFNGGIAGVFNTDQNGAGIVVSTGGILEESDVRNVATGTGKCINNSGTFVNNGNNSCESMYAVITATTEAVNTVTLTVTTQGANVSATCAVGDSVYVQGVAVAGYNGFFRYAVTAVGTNTLSYTNPTSGLGNSSGGSAFCIGLSTFSGTLPYSTLTPTPNTCYVTVAFAAVTLCNQFVDRSTNIYHIKASSSTTTACTVAPVVTISDGTNTATLTITTAKASWDSSVDASSGVGTTSFTPHGGTLTVSTTAGTCTTSPTNFAVTYTMQGILDNF